MLKDRGEREKVKRDELPRRELSSPRRCRHAIFVPRCKSFYKVCVSSLFSKLDTKRIFSFSPQVSARKYVFESLLRDSGRMYVMRITHMCMFTH